MSPRYSLTIIGILGITGVILGAFGAHALKELLLSRGASAAWETAVIYQLLHTVALLAITLAKIGPNDGERSPFAWTTRFWLAGVVLFSGSIYVLALGGPRLFGPVTPLGGVAFILGWGSLIIEARRAFKGV